MDIPILLRPTLGEFGRGQIENIFEMLVVPHAHCQTQEFLVHKPILASLQYEASSDILLCCFLLWAD